MTMLKYSEMWNASRFEGPVAVEILRLEFTFNLRSGPYDWTQNRKFMKSLNEALGQLKQFLISDQDKLRCQYKLSGDIDSAQRDTFMKEFEVPLTMADILNDMQRLFQEANALRRTPQKDSHDQALEMYGDICLFLCRAEARSGL